MTASADADAAAHAQRKLDDARAEAAVARGLRMACLALPHLASLAQHVRISASPRVPTIGVFASGRIVVNPLWFLALLPAEGTFVVAHELMHLALRSHQRGLGVDPVLFNLAHDYIINAELEPVLQMDTPAGGLCLHELLLCAGENRAVGRWADGDPTGGLSAETLIARYGDQLRKMSSRAAWSRDSVLDRAKRRQRKQRAQVGTSALADALRGAGLVANASDGTAEDPDVGASDLDVLDADTEGNWFPGPTPKELAAMAEAIGTAGLRAMALDMARKTAQRMLNRGTAPGEAQATIESLHTAYRPPWHAALQTWLHANTPANRTYMRASRRGAFRDDVVLAGRDRTGWTLNVILDTSGSMSFELPRALGAIGSFCRDVGVDSVRVLQCDAEVTRDERVEPEQLDNYAIEGFGGSDMTAAMDRLAADPEVQAVVVITDGYVEVPREPPPYTVLWVLTSDTSWHIEYGMVVRMDDP